MAMSPTNSESIDDSVERSTYSAGVASLASALRSLYDEYLAAVEEAVADFAPLRSPEVTDALEQTAIAMRSVGN